MGYYEQILALGYTTSKPRGAGENEGTTSFDPATGEIENSFDDNPWAEINARAMKNLGLFVPALNLYKNKRNPGRGYSLARLRHGGSRVPDDRWNSARPI